jgi:hypothetical protein
VSGLFIISDKNNSLDASLRWHDIECLDSHDSGNRLEFGILLHMIQFE